MLLYRTSSDPPTSVIVFLPPPGHFFSVTDYRLKGTVQALFMDAFSWNQSKPTKMYESANKTFRRTCTAGGTCWVFFTSPNTIWSDVIFLWFLDFFPFFLLRFRGSVSGPCGASSFLLLWEPSSISQIYKSVNDVSINISNDRRFRFGFSFLLFCRRVWVFRTNMTPQVAFLLALVRTPWDRAPMPH